MRIPRGRWAIVGLIVVSMVVGLVAGRLTGGLGGLGELSDVMQTPG